MGIPKSVWTLLSIRLRNKIWICEKLLEVMQTSSCWILREGLQQVGSSSAVQSDEDEMEFCWLQGGQDLEKEKVGRGEPLFTFWCFPITHSWGCIQNRGFIWKTQHKKTRAWFLRSYGFSHLIIPSPKFWQDKTPYSVFTFYHPLTPTHTPSSTLEQLIIFLLRMPPFLEANFSEVWNQFKI